VHVTFEFESDQKQMSDQGSPDLDQYGIFGGAIEGGDFQVLLDPLEKEFDLPGRR
jgi:hypothetical protein